jgi:hypothetical protein
VALVTVRLPVTAVAPDGTSAADHPMPLTPATVNVFGTLVTNLPEVPMFV